MLPNSLLLLANLCWTNYSRINIKMDAIELLQWPAMIITIVAAWLVASNQKKRRNVGFWLFLLSNALWITWGIHDKAWALVALQVGLAAMNIRGALKTYNNSSAT